MPLRVRVRILAAGVAAILPLLFLVLYSPPDGLQRGEWSQFLGRFHPIAVHLPIALLLLVPLLEFAALFHELGYLRQAAEFVLGLATAAAIASAWLGWLLAWSGGYEGSLVTRHMWGGLCLACVSLVCWGLYEKRTAYLVVLLTTVGLLTWTSDQGGKLTHGETFLTEHSPAPLRDFLGEEKKTAVDPTSFYAMRVQPIFDGKCLTCHSASKFKGKLRLDSYDHVMRGGKDGPIIHPGATAESELLRRVTLPRESKEFMPAEGKPALSAAEIKVIEVWITQGAKVQVADSAVAELSSPSEPKAAEPPLTGDYRPQLKIIAELESSLGIRLVPRSQSPTDGLILRTMSAPAKCTDATLEQLAPVANLIVEAELARTKVTDKGMPAIAGFSNLRLLDLSNTGVTSAGTKELMKLGKLESLNLTQTKVTHSGIEPLQNKPGLKRLYFFEAQ